MCHEYLINCNKTLVLNITGSSDTCLFFRV